MGPIAEAKRIARRAVVVLTVDSESADSYWLIRDSFPEGRALFAPAPPESTGN